MLVVDVWRASVSIERRLGARHSPGSSNERVGGEKDDGRKLLLLLLPLLSAMLVLPPLSTGNSVDTHSHIHSRIRH